MKRNLPKQSTYKKFLEVDFFYKQYITKKFHKHFSKKLNKKNSRNFHFYFQKTKKKIVRKKRRFKVGYMSINSPI